MRKRIMIFVMIMLFGFQQSSATVFSDMLPAGKNYFEGNNFTVVDGTMYTNEPFRVKPLTTYTFSIPNQNMLGFPELHIWSENEEYIFGDVDSISNCEMVTDYTACTFTTLEDDYLEIELSAFGLDQFTDVYGFYEFQLEEGTEKTEYEEYIPLYTDVTSPDFEGGGVFIKAYYEEITLVEIITQHIIVYDDIDGDLTDSIEIVNDTYSAHMYTVGEYPVDLEVADSSGNIATFQLVILVKDDILPVLTGPTEITVSIDEQAALIDIIDVHYEAVDLHDGELSIAVVTDNYTSNRTVLGLYAVEMSATDSSGNETTKNISVRVADVTPPEVLSSDTITVNLSDPLSFNDVLNSIVVSDNYDDVEDVLIQVVLDNFTGYESVPGIYNIELLIADTADNSVAYSLVVVVQDDIEPTISGPDELSTSYTNAYNINYLLSLIEVDDNYDDLTTSDIEIISNTYTSAATEVGTYIIMFEIVDAAGNAASHSITIEVVDDQAPKIYLDNSLITVTPHAVFSPKDALNMMIKNKEIPEGEYEILTIKDEYTGHENIPGTYEYRVKFVNHEGQTIEKDFMINVAEMEEVETSKDTMVRNIIVYGLTIVFIGFVIHKTKK